LSQIDGEEEQSDIDSLVSDQGEQEDGDEIKLTDGIGSSAQAQACRDNSGPFRRAQANSSSILNSIIHRHVSVRARILVPF
jgi:hypothetical protein